jgi:hypothetical protein
MRNLVAALMVAGTLASGQSPRSVEYHHLYTFGSKQGFPPEGSESPASHNRSGTGRFPLRNRISGWSNHGSPTPGVDNG